MPQAKYPEIPYGSPATCGALLDTLLKLKAAWTDEDIKYLGEFEEQRIPIWIPGEGYDYCLFEPAPEASPFMLAPEHEPKKRDHASTNMEKIMTDMTGKYVIVRTINAGVHAGVLEYRNGQEVVLSSARRIWYWAGAASLSQLAMDGTSKPEDCKFPKPVNEILLTEAIEIIPCSEIARKSIESVPEWSA